jgi:hypothetical protein
LAAAPARRVTLLFSEKKEKGLDVWDAFLVEKISSTGIAGGETKIHFATDVV